LTTWASVVQCQKESNRITLLDVSRDLPTSQTMSTTISISVVSTTHNTISSTQ
jgi:hypothetical protein